MVKFVATKSADWPDLQALHRCGNGWSASVPASSIKSGPSCSSVELRLCASTRRAATHPRHATRCPIATHGAAHRGPGKDWRRLDERVEGLTGEIEAIARQDTDCERLMSVPGIGPIISSAMAAIGRGDVFSKWTPTSALKAGAFPKQNIDR